MDAIFLLPKQNRLGLSFPVSKEIKSLQKYHETLRLSKSNQFSYNLYLLYTDETWIKKF